MKHHIITLILSSILITGTCVEARSASTFVPRTSLLLPPISIGNTNNKHSINNSDTCTNRNGDDDCLPALKQNHDQSQQQQRGIGPVSRIPRGGSLTVDREEEEIDNGSGESNGFVVTKLRNIIRSIVEIGEKKSPVTTKLVKLMVRCAEKMTGLDLLPSKKNKKLKVKAKKKKSKSKSTKLKDSIGNTSETVTSKAASTKANKKQNRANSGAAQAHVSKAMKANNPNYRIQRELKEFLRSPPPNLSVKVGKNIRVWIITMTGTAGSLYEGEKYRLRVTFPADYPTSPPSVYFLQPTPRHEHVYTNGDICLSLLGKDWRPTMTAQSIANSILSILSGASRKSLPMDNVAHAQNKPGGKQDDWIYHDDNC